MPEAEAPNPYVGPYAFEEKHADLFTGRDTEAETLLSLVISESIVVFCSPSGAGKTSLLNARLIPELRRKGFRVFPVARVGRELPAKVVPANVYSFNAIRFLAGEETDPESLRDQPLHTFLHPGARGDDGEDSTGRILILDQFEEILTTYPERWEQRRDFFLQLQQALRDDSSLSAVLALREDHLAGLDTYAPLLPGQLRTRFRMDKLRRRDAVDAARKPARVAGRPFEPGVAERLVDDLALVHVAGKRETVPGEFVEPVQLQVVCYQLWENLRSKPGGTITEDDRRESGNPDRALEGFYVSAVRRAAGTGVPEDQIRRWCGTRLITSTHIRGQVSREPGASGGLPNTAVESLVDSHLVRAEVARGGTWYELAHDRFIEPILRSNERATPSGSNLLAADAQAWRDTERDPSFLYRGLRLKEASRGAEAAGDLLTPLEREFLAASQKAKAAEQTRNARRLRAAVSVLAILLLAVGILAYVAWQQSRLSFSRELALSAGSSAERDPDLGLLLALEAGKLSSASEVEAALHQTLSASTFRRSLSIPIASDSARSFALSPSGNSFAAVGDDGKLGIWETETGRRLRTFEGLTAPIGSAVFSPDGSELAAGNTQAHVVVWSIRTAKPVSSFDPGGEEVNALAFSPKGDLLAVATDDPDPALWNAASGKKERTFAGGHSGLVWDIAFAPDGKTLATAGEDQKVILWNVNSGRPIRAPLIHPKPVLGVTFGPDGALATACQDAAARTWNPQTGEMTQTFFGHRGWVWGVTFSTDGKYLATASADTTAKIWNRASGDEVRTLSPGSGPLVRAAFSPRSGQLLTIGEAPPIDTGDRKGTATLWNVLLEDVPTLTYHKLPIQEIAFSRDSQRMATTDRSGQTILWDSTGRRLAILQDDSFWKSSISRPQLDLEGKRLAMPGRDGAVRIWEIPSGHELQALRGHEGPVIAVAFSMDGRLLATAGMDRLVKLWNLAEGRVILTFPKQESRLSDLVFSPDGKLLATALASGTVTLWTVADGSKNRNLPGHTILVYDVRFSPDGRLLASAGADRSVRLWDVKSGRELLNLASQTEATGIAFNTEGSRLASTGSDGSTTLWDVTTGKELFTLQGHRSRITRLAFRPDGRWLAIAGIDGSVRLEPMKIEVLIERARKRLLRRELTPPERRIYLHEN